MATSLENQYIDESYQKVVQVSGSFIADGTGSVITNLNLTASHAVSASYAVSASHEIVKEISSSYADVAGIADAVSGSNVVGAVGTANTASYVSAANIDGTVATATSASYSSTASYAENAGDWSGVYEGDAQITGSISIKDSGSKGAIEVYGSPVDPIIVAGQVTKDNVKYFIDQGLQVNDELAILGANPELKFLSNTSTGSLTDDGFRFTNNNTGLVTGDYNAQGFRIFSESRSLPGILDKSVILSSTANGVVQTQDSVWGLKYVNTPANVKDMLVVNPTTNQMSSELALSSSNSISASAFKGDGTDITGVISASYAATASYALNSVPQVSASYAENATSASYALIATNAASASIANSATTALLATSASHAVNSNTSISASHAIIADTSISASHAIQADNATTATTATTAISAIGATNTDVQVKNLEATQIDKGTPLFFTDSGTSGNIVGVYRADAANPARMPAGGIAGEDIAAGAEGQAFLDGYIGGVDTNLFTSGDIVYVAAGGGYINSRPTGSNVQVQALGYVAKAAINGSGVIKGPGVANDLPNLPTGQIVVGDGGGTYQFVTTSSLSVASAVSASHAIYAETAGNAGTWDGQYSGSAGITGSLTVSSVLDVTGVDNLGTNNVSVTDIYGVEVLKVQGLPANKRQNSLIVSGGMQVILPTFQSRFEIAGLAGNTIVAGANIGANDSSGQYSAGIAGGNGGVVQVTDNFNNNDFGIAGQMQQWGYLGDWTGPGIYSNDPGGNYPTIVGFEDASNWTDGRVTFLTPISASAGVTGSLNVSGALSATGNITATNGYIAAFNGNDIFTTVGGNIENRVGTLANNTEKDLVQLGPVTDQFGNTYNLAHNLLANYPSFGKFYRGSYGVEFWDSYGYNYGNEFYVSPLGTRYQMFSPQGKYGADTFEVKTSGTNIGDTRKLINVQEYRVTVDGDTPEAVGYTITNPSGSLAASSSYATFGVGQSYNDPTKTSYSTQANSLNFGNYGPNSGDVEITFGGPHGSFVNMSTSGSSLNLNKGAGFPYIQLDADHRINLYSQNINISSSANINVDALDTYIRSDVEITGSVNISETIKLAPQNPLPTGALGELAVSASNLYFHNGTSWSQIN